MAHVAGLVAAGVYPSPLPHAHVVTSTTHKTLRGPRGGIVLAKNPSEELVKKLQSIVFPGIQGGPLMHVIAAKAVAFKEALDPGVQGLPGAGGEERQGDGEDPDGPRLQGRVRRHREPPDADRPDRPRELGKDAEAALGKAHITVNKNAVPNDPRSPFVTSGLRIGTPAVTTRGYKEPECVALASGCATCSTTRTTTRSSPACADNVVLQCRNFPVYG
jgi:glycine hydroxymethyltransferase